MMTWTLATGTLGWSCSRDPQSVARQPQAWQHPRWGWELAGGGVSTGLNLDPEGSDAVSR